MLIPVCEIDEVPVGEGRELIVEDRAIALFRAEAGWFALDAACPHEGGPLADGIVAHDSVICPLHERRFALGDGHEIGGELCVAVHPAHVRGSTVWVELPSAA